MVEFNAATIAGGGLVERLNDEVHQAVANCLDINTPADKTRTITLKVKIKPDKTRCVAGVTVETSSALCPLEGYFVGFSDGKDSITTLELCCMADVKHQAFYSCTGIDPPEMYAFIRKHYPEVIWLHPKRSFYSSLQIAGPPIPFIRRWCCDKLKKSPSRLIPLNARIIGIRAEESIKRASFPRIGQYNRGQTLFKPIFYQPEWAVQDFIDARGFTYPSLYDEGFGRIGCVVCPFTFAPGEAAQRRIAISQARWPGIWKAFRHAVFRWFDTKMVNGLRPNQRYKSAEDFWQAHLRGGAYKKEMQE